MSAGGVLLSFEPLIIFGGLGEQASRKGFERRQPELGEQGHFSDTQSEPGLTVDLRFDRNEVTRIRERVASIDVTLN